MKKAAAAAWQTMTLGLNPEIHLWPRIYIIIKCSDSVKSRDEFFDRVWSFFQKEMQFTAIWNTSLHCHFFQFPFLFCIFHLLMCYELTCLCSLPKGFAQLLPWGSWSTGQGLLVCCQADCLSRLPLAHWSTMITKQKTLEMWFGYLKPELLSYTWSILEQMLRTLPSVQGAWQTARTGFQRLPSWTAPASVLCHD